MVGRVRFSLRSLALLISIAIGMLLPADHAVAQQTGLKDMIYVSPHWGYSIRWYSSEWIIGDEQSDADADLLQLTDSLGNAITYTGLEGFQGDADACLDQMVGEVVSIPGAGDVAQAEGDFGTPYEWRDASQSYTVFQIRLPVNGVLVDHAVYAECQTLVPGKAVFQRLYTGPVEVFDQYYDDIAQTLDGVFLPASAWLPMPDSEVAWAGSAPLLSTSRLNASLVPSASDAQLLVGLVDASGDTRIVTFENVSDAPVSVDPNSLVLSVTAMTDETLPPEQRPSSIAWEDGSVANADGTRALAPGERATVQVGIPPVDTSTMTCDGLPSLTLEYRPADGESVTIGSSALALSECLNNVVAAPAGGSRPRLRLAR
jgi:hypothetical protein